MRICLAQFAKSPEYDPVKTRLRPVLSELQCIVLHKNLLTYGVEQLHALSNIELCMWSSKGGEFIDQLCHRYSLAHFRQRGDGLGQRLAYALRSSLNDFDAAILIGSDCPYLNGDILLEVAQQLQSHDVIIVPAQDGGYVLLASQVYHPEFFRDISWGSDAVLAQTLRQVEALGLTVLCLAPLSDIDRPEDLSALLAQAQFSHLMDG